MGIGDRTRFLLGTITAITEAAREYTIELDYPQAANTIELRFPRAFEYRDPWLFVAELFHFRAYGSPKETVSLDDDDEQGRGGDQVVTFTSSHKISYDTCFFYTLFRPTDRLQTEISYYSNLFRLDTKNVLGIHLRTGDMVAFGDVPGMHHNLDVRLEASNLEGGYNKMLECAEKLATRLDIYPMVDTTTTTRYNRSNGDLIGSPKEKLHFYLATDNPLIKYIAKKEQRYVIHLTDDEPVYYRKSDGDRNAYLELYLLSKTRGLVMNSLPDNYKGKTWGSSFSSFAVLAEKLGAMADEQIMHCRLD